MSASIDTASLTGSLHAIRMSYTKKNKPDPGRVIRAPWTRRDLDDMLYIRNSLEWLLSEIKSGHDIIGQKHDWTIRNVLSLGAALDRKEQEFLAKAGFNPSQPRVPAGHANGGQWAAAGGGRISLPIRKPTTANVSPESLRPALTTEELEKFNRRAPPGTPPEDLDIDPAFGLPRWYVRGAVRPTLSPLDFAGSAGAIRAAGSLARATITEAGAIAQVLRARSTGGKAAGESVTKIRKAADAVESFLGGRPNPQDVKINPKGDIIIMKGDKKFRMDIKNPGYKHDADGKLTPDEPHFHLQELKKNGKWGDATNGHRIYFRKGDLQK